MEAELIVHNKVIAVDGSIVEIKLWKVETSSDKSHGYKYSLAHIVNGKRVIGYDNAEGKGDHRHYQNKVEPYDFKGLDKLVDNFYKDIMAYREESL